ncbi:hypothetical protein PFISCL1PPCAC_6076, partial [Pristionchus fissidentatus]
VIIFLSISLVSTQWTNAGLASIPQSEKNPELIYAREFDLPKNAPRAHAIRFIDKNERWITGKMDEETGVDFRLIKNKLDEMKMHKHKKGGRLVIDNESEFIGSI